MSEPPLFDMILVLIGGEHKTEYLRRSSMLPPYMAYPRFLLTMNISETAKLVYVLLLDRARLSMTHEGWEDENGHVFIYSLIHSQMFTDYLLWAQPWTG